MQRALGTTTWSLQPRLGLHSTALLYASALELWRQSVVMPPTYTGDVRETVDIILVVALPMALHISNPIVVEIERRIRNKYDVARFARWQAAFINAVGHSRVAWPYVQSDM